MPSLERDGWNNQVTISIVRLSRIEVLEIVLLEFVSRNNAGLRWCPSKFSAPVLHWGGLGEGAPVGTKNQANHSGNPSVVVWIRKRPAIARLFRFVRAMPFEHRVKGSTHVPPAQSSNWSAESQCVQRHPFA